MTHNPYTAGDVKKAGTTAGNHKILWQMDTDDDAGRSAAERVFKDNHYIFGYFLCTDGKARRGWVYKPYKPASHSKAA